MCLTPEVFQCYQFDVCVKWSWKSVERVQLKINLLKDQNKKRLDRFKKLHDKDVRESMHIYFNFKEILETENMLNSDRFIFVEMKIEKTINTFLS